MNIRSIVKHGKYMIYIGLPSSNGSTGLVEMI